MPTLVPKDTSIVAAREYYRLIGERTPQDRLVRMFELIAFSREISRAGIRHQYPDMSEAEVEHELARRILGPELFQSVHGEPEPVA